MINSVEIAKHSGDSRAGSWHHVLYCTFCADGTISLRVELRGDARTHKPKGVRGIRSAKQFIDGIDQVCANTSLADHIDYYRVCTILAEHRATLAANLRKLVKGDQDSDLPPDIEKAIDTILQSPTIYPNVKGSLVGMRLRHENTRSALINYYMATGKFPEGAFTVDGHVIDLTTIPNR